MRLSLAIASFVALIVHGIVFYDQFFHRWERYQTAYFDQARTLTKNARERAELEERRPRIEQYIVTQFGDTRVDRCGTCHIAADDPRFEKYAEPLRTHPFSAALGDVERNGRWERRHKFADFGCTVCHDGQGRGLDTHYSHGEDPFWPEPMLGFVVQSTWRKSFAPKLLGKEYMEANCAQCHTEENFSGTPHVNRGRKLFYAMNCYGCHRIEGMSEGTLGPDLSEAGKKYRVDYLWQHILDPRVISATSFMPKFNLNDGDIRSLVIFLKSRRGINFAETSLDQYRMRVTETKLTVTPPGKPEVKGETLAARGKQLIEDRACTACHKLGAVDGGIAPDLSYEGLIKDQDWLVAHFRNPRSRIPDSIMPAFRFPDTDFEALSGYLASLRTPPPALSPAETFQQLCARCHGEKGDGNGKVAWYLDPAPRDLTKAGFMTSKPRERFLKSIREGVPGTSMPAWGHALKEEQPAAVLDYVFTAFVKEPSKPPVKHNVPETNPVASTPESIQAGEQIFVLRCAGCHGRKADGKGPNSLDISPRPRNLRNSFFVNSVADRRLFDSILYGVQGTAMPSWIDYGLSQNDVGNIVNFIRSLGGGRAVARAGLGLEFNRSHYARN
ncbi:MAG TPA: c-type cytochrome [Bryobacteraceae bacterium]|nr:c-type cytochrome [Bryobacteraceae bacterium]